MPNGQYDVSPQERRNIEDRAILRKELRSEFLRLYSNPHRMATGEGGYGFDPVLQRWLSMRAQHWHYFKPNIKTLVYPAIVAGTVLSYWWLISWDRNNKETAYRTGQISYRDRKNKFI